MGKAIITSNATSGVANVTDEQVILSNGMTLKDWNLAQSKGYCFIALRCVDANGDPVIGVPVAGVYAEDGETALHTDADGYVRGYGYASENYSISTPTYFDYDDAEHVLNLTTYALGTYDLEINYGDKKNYGTVTSSRQVTFSPMLTAVKGTLVGGGGGGGHGSYGTGGGGGYVENFELNIGEDIQHSTQYNVAIGGGGGAGSESAVNGGAGGNSSFLNFSANGGGGGSDGAVGVGNGDGGGGGRSVGGGYGSSPTAGSVLGYHTDTDQVYYGGGGGGSAYGEVSSPQYGAGYGATGAWYGRDPANNYVMGASANATTPRANMGGGGGGGMTYKTKSASAGAAGRAVFVFVR